MTRKINHCIEYGKRTVCEEQVGQAVPIGLEDRVKRIWLGWVERTPLTERMVRIW